MIDSTRVSGTVAAARHLGKIGKESTDSKHRRMPTAVWEADCAIGFTPSFSSGAHLTGRQPILGVDGKGSASEAVAQQDRLVSSLA